MTAPAGILTSAAAAVLSKSQRKVLLALIADCSASGDVDGFTPISNVRIETHHHLSRNALPLTFRILVELGLVEMQGSAVNEARRFRLGTGWAAHDLAQAQAIVIAARSAPAPPKEKQPPKPEKAPLRHAGVRSKKMEAKLAGNAAAQAHHDPPPARKITLAQIPWPTKPWDDLV